MKLMRFFFVTIALTGAWLQVTAGGAAPVELLTAEEAAQPNIPKGPVTGQRSVIETESKAPSPGAPQIIVDTPSQGVGVTAPFPVKIRFVPSSGSKINVDSVKVEVLKFVTISLLSKVKPYLSPTGINVPEAKIPAGTYNVRIAVTDDQGREGDTVQVWTVR
jgi:hypothetical protein